MTDIGRYDHTQVGEVSPVLRPYGSTYPELIAWLRATIAEDAGHQLLLDKIIGLESAADMRDGCCHTAAEIEVGGAGTHSDHSHYFAFDDALRAFARLYADRPGYRDEWRQWTDDAADW